MIEILVGDLMIPVKSTGTKTLYFYLRFSREWSPGKGKYSTNHAFQEESGEIWYQS